MIFFLVMRLLIGAAKKICELLPVFRSVSPLDAGKMHGCTDIYFERSTLFLVLTYLPLHLLKNKSLSIAILYFDLKQKLN